MRAVRLLRDALVELDRDPVALDEAVRCRGFAGGAQWMARRMGSGRGAAPRSPAFDGPNGATAALAPSHDRREAKAQANTLVLPLSINEGDRCATRRPAPIRDPRFGVLGTVKYGLATAAILGVIAAGVALRSPGLAAVAIFVAPLAFYAVEVQMVFLFPVALAGSRRPFRDARADTVRAGGTLATMATVLPVAAFMLGGGLAGRGFVRCWAAGCLAVVRWWEELPDTGAEWFDPVDVLGMARLRLRTEAVAGDISATLLLVSDLHLGRPWNRGLPRQVLRLARRTRPTLVLLAGDLLDTPGGAAALGRLLRRLARVAPLVVLPGNHDRDPTGLRLAVLAAGGAWLDDGPVCVAGVRVTAEARPPEGRAAFDVQCVHRPSDFAGEGAFALRLAGHLHGGQCVLARWRGRLLPAWWVHRWHVDRLDRGGTTSLVSRGAGDTLPLRFNCPREAVLCRVGRIFPPTSRGPGGTTDDGPAPVAL